MTMPNLPQIDSQYQNLESEYSKNLGPYYEFARPEMIEFVPKTAERVLEVGCGSGGFGSLLKLQRPGVEVWGLEPNDEAASRAAERLDCVICDVLHPSIPRLDGQLFDCVVFNDVLEHLARPESALDDVKKYLTDQGVVVASIPNILHFYQISSILIEQDWKYQDSGILDNTHLRFFTKKSIIRLFEQSGYRLLDIKGIYESFGLKYRILNLLTFNHLRDWRYVQFAVVAKPLR